MKFKCFIIHLERAKERLHQVETIKKSFPKTFCEVVGAVDNIQLSEADLNSYYMPKKLSPEYPFALNKGEVACFLSHRLCWQRIIDMNLDAALIVEDDLEIEQREFDKAFKLVTNKLEKNSYVRFPTKQREAVAEVVLKDGQTTLFRPKVVGLKTTAQIVNVDAARRLLASSSTFDRPVDSFLQMHWIHGVEMYSVQPAGVAEKISGLGGSSIQKKVTFSSKFRREIERFLYRIKITNLSK